MFKVTESGVRLPKRTLGSLGSSRVLLGPRKTGDILKK